MEKRIEERLKRCNLPELLEHPKKTLIRIKEIESYVLIMEEKFKSLIDEIKENKITKVSIANNIGISRKTLYNDEILKIYCEDVIMDIPDYLNEKELREVRNKIEEININYNKLLNNIIDNNKLKIKIREFESEILILVNRNYELEKTIYEKNHLLEKSNNKLNNGEKVIKFRK